MKNKKAFTLAEMMVVLLVISLAVAAFMPIMTKRAKSSSSSGGNGNGNANNIWQYVSDTDKDIYTSEGPALGAIIGATSFTAGDNARLMINTSGLGQADILMKQSGNQAGILVSDGNGNVGLGNVSFDAAVPTKNNQIAIGSGAKTSASSDIALGLNANSSGDGAIAMGFTAISSGSSGISLGFNAHGSGDSAIAIGNGANNNNTDCIAIGSGATTTSPYGGNPGIAIGDSAKATGGNTLALGSQSQATYGESTAIGVDAKTTGYKQIMLGRIEDAVVIPGRFKLGQVSNPSDPNNSSLGDGTPHAWRSSDGLWNIFVASKSTSDNYSTPSDRRLKNIKGENTSGLDQIRKLKTYNFLFKKDKDKIPQVGVIAQDLQKVFPNAVIKGKDGYFLIRQEDMFYAMVNSIKQLDVITQGLVKDFKSLVARIQTIDDRIIALIKVDQINGKKIKDLELKNKLLEKQNKNFEIRLKKLEKK